MIYKTILPVSFTKWPILFVRACICFFNEAIFRCKTNAVAFSPIHPQILCLRIILSGSTTKINRYCGTQKPFMILVASWTSKIGIYCFNSRMYMIQNICSVTNFVVWEESIILWKKQTSKVFIPLWLRITKPKYMFFICRSHLIQLGKYTFCLKIIIKYIF